jgi:hypothetical protein
MMMMFNVKCKCNNNNNVPILLHSMVIIYIRLLFFSIDFEISKKVTLKRMLNCFLSWNCALLAL